MPIYAKKVQSSNPIFHNRESIVVAAVEELATRIPILDSITLCNGCNQNISEGYLVYLGKRELKANQPYDYYCSQCVKNYFPKAVIVEE